jgi:uncharacterized protein
MKKVFLILFLLAVIGFTVEDTAKAQSNPAVWTVDDVPNTKLQDAGTYVSDPDNLLDQASKTEINNLLGQAESQSSAEVFVVALKSVGEVYIKDFATSLFNKWGIGKKSKDNGLLILMVEDQSKVSFETGYGMEGVFPDAICMRIISNDIIPSMKEGNYGQGILNGVKAVKKIIDNPKVADEIRQDMAAEEAASHEANIQKIRNILIGYIALSILVLILSFVSVSKKKLVVETVKVPKIKSVSTENSSVQSDSQDIEKKISSQPVRVSGGKMAVNAMAPYQEYKQMSTFRSVYNVLAVLFPVTMIFFLVWYKSKMRKLRLMPRACPVCAHPMLRMNESQEDVYLNTGQQNEELVGSIDYDAWVCMDCGQKEIIPYGKEFTKYKECPKCGYKTYALVKDRILLSPTPISNGQGEKIYSCTNCQHEVRKSYIIPMIIIVTSGRGHGGGFGGGGGGGFGGGMSGGGGATGSW